MMSFRRRIQYWTLALIAVLLLAFDIGVYWSFSKVLHQYVDSRLKAMAESWAGIAGPNLDLFLNPSQHAQEAAVRSAAPTEREQIELREAALSIQVLSLDGTVLSKGAAVATTPSGDRGQYAQITQGKEVFETVHHPTGVSVRRVWVPIWKQGQVRYILQAETPLRLMSKALNGLAILLASASGVMLLLAWAGSTWLARQALMPVEILSETALKISQPSSLGTRLVLDVPYAEFRRLAEAFNSMMDRIQKVVEEQRRFVADAAHEIQTPLTALKGNLEVAFRQNRDATQYRETLISNLSAVERLISLCRSLLTLARLAGENPFLSAHELIPLQPLLQDLIDELTVLSRDRGIALRLEGNGSLGVQGDKEQLQRLFFNLLDNALRHTPAGGTIVVRLENDRGGAIIQVLDTGEGIASEHLPHIFDRFYRVDSARSRHSGGAGLGLAIVKQIIDAHGGSITVASELGHGTRFTIRLQSINKVATTQETIWAMSANRTQGA